MFPLNVSQEQTKQTKTDEEGWDKRKKVTEII